MAVEKLMGYRRLDFKTEDGTLVQGTQLHTSYEEDGVVGEACGKLFIRDGIDLPSLTPGMALEIVYNRKGKPVTVKAVAKQ